MSVLCRLVALKLGNMTSLQELDSSGNNLTGEP